MTIIKKLNLYGLISQQHAKDIEEILENYEREVRKETAKMVCDRMTEEESSLKCTDREEEICDFGYNARIKEEKEIVNQILKEL